jgi:hypothetical protein
MEYMDLQLFCIGCQCKMKMREKEKEIKNPQIIFRNENVIANIILQSAFQSLFCLLSSLDA